MIILKLLAIPIAFFIGFQIMKITPWYVGVLFIGFCIYKLVEGHSEYKHNQWLQGHLSKTYQVLGALGKTNKKG